MGLGKCQDCRGQMSDSAESCPHCGSTNRPVTTKQRIRERRVVECHVCEGTGTLYKIHYKTRSKGDTGRLLFPWRWKDWDHQECMLRPSWLESERKKLLKYHPGDQIEITSTDKIQCSECGGSGQREIVNYETYEEEM